MESKVIAITVALGLVLASGIVATTFVKSAFALTATGGDGGVGGTNTAGNGGEPGNGGTNTAGTGGANAGGTGGANAGGTGGTGQWRSWQPVAAVAVMLMQTAETLRVQTAEMLRVQTAETLRVQTAETAETAVTLRVQTADTAVVYTQPQLQHKRWCRRRADGGLGGC